MKKKIIAIIPARGGSKGVKKKNIKFLGNKPLIAYTIETALDAKVFDEIHVSTESEEISEISKKLGASVPFLRPSYLADDNSPTIDTLIYVLISYKKINMSFDFLVLLQPTTPFRSVDTIISSLERLFTQSADSLISVNRIPDKYNPYWSFIEKNDQTISPYTGANIVSRRQDLPNAYYRNGEIYISRVDLILETKSLYSGKLIHYENRDCTMINIDTNEDWDNAEQYIKGRI